ncbi:hypothetical protein LDENG_00242570 [Lucifuga dentata]|nr:hypothetical protein LDENG_00242570 [Lucifuga dentata]
MKFGLRTGLTSPEGSVLLRKEETDTKRLLRDNMDSFQGPCPHRSIPVEMDESMTSFFLDLSCQQCSGFAETPQRPRAPAGGSGPVPHRWKRPEAPWEDVDQYQQEVPAPVPGFLTAARPGLHGTPHAFREEAPYEHDPHQIHQRGFVGPSEWPQDRSAEEAERLESPFPLMSDFSCTHAVPPRYPVRYPAQAQEIRPRTCPCHLPAPPPCHDYNHRHHHINRYPVDPHPAPLRLQQPSIPAAQRVAPPPDVLQEVSVNPSVQARTGAAVKETKRTISLPAECSFTAGQTMESEP